MQAKHKYKLSLQHLWPGPGVAVVGGVKDLEPLKPRGGRAVGDQGKGYEGQNRELSLGGSL